jgi:hypothetical protein
MNDELIECAPEIAPNVSCGVEVKSVLDTVRLKQLMQKHSHAALEFRAAEWVNDNGEFSDEMQAMICLDILELIEVFSNQGHSGSTAPYTVSMFEKLAMHKPIVPLTGEYWEWNCISDARTDTVPVFQNKRCSSVFKQPDRYDGQPYDIDGKVFRETTDENGDECKYYYYTSKDSHVPIEFPYTPKTEYVDV